MKLKTIILSVLMVAGLQAGQVKKKGGLLVNITQKGSGKEATKGSRVKVHYTGRLKKSNKVFDSSVKRNVPFEFILGKGQVIQGWDIGVEGMKVGEKRTLEIPPALGYGARGAGNVIPPGATLIFDIELLDVK